jgi:hypothetical protein
MQATECMRIVISSNTLDTGMLAARIADPFFWRLLAEALFLPGIPLDRICIFVRPRVGSCQGKTEDYVHYAGILFVREATICKSGQLTDSFRELYGLRCLGHPLRCLAIHQTIKLSWLYDPLYL